MMDKRERIKVFGEVFTSLKEVNAMLDLTQKETFRTDSRFLEPACGNGNFLYEILSRKLNILLEKFSNNKLDYQRQSLLAVSSLYGIDILKDNVNSAVERLLNLYKNKYQFDCDDKQKLFNSCEFILNKNIVNGDAISLKDINKQPIVFSEWSIVNNSYFKRRDFTFKELIANQPFDTPNLFSDLGDEAFIPTPIKEFPLQHFLNLK